MVSYIYIHFGVRRERVSKFRRKKTLEDRESEERERRERERERERERDFQFFFLNFFFSSIDIVFSCFVSVCVWYHIFTFRISKFRRKKTLKRFRYFRSLFVVVEVINRNHILSIRLDFEEGERES